MNTSSSSSNLLAMVDRASRSTSAKRNNWLGLPIGQLPHLYKPYLDAAIRDGLLEIAERPSTTDPKRKAAFVRRVGA